MSGLPSPIQAQLDQAAVIEAQMYGTPAPEGNPVEPMSTETPDVPTPEVQQPAPVASQSADLEHRFKVLQGKYNAETPKLHQQVRELSQKLEQAVTALQSKADAPKPKEESLVTEADVEAFGADLVSMARRAAQDEFKKLSKQFVEDMDRRYAPVVEQVKWQEQRIVQSDEEKFWGAVHAPTAAPDFESVNADPRWFAFLDTRVPGTSFTRRSMAEEALTRLDATALIEQVAEYKRSIGEAPNPAPDMTKTTTKAAKPSLSSQVSPSSSRATVPTSPTAGRRWTSAEYQAAMDHRQLKFITREEYDARVAEADQALAEGRVQF